MIVRKNKYAIASVDFPLCFYDDKGNEYYDINDFGEFNILYPTKELAEDVLNQFDSPEDCHVLEIGVAYEF